MKKIPRASVVGSLIYLSQYWFCC